MLVFDKLLSLTPRKLNLAMLIIAISSLGGIIVYLFKSNETVSEQRYADCKEELSECIDKYDKLVTQSNNQINLIYSNVIADMKDSKKVITEKVNDISLKRQNIKRKQEYLNNILQKLESYEK